MKKYKIFIFSLPFLLIIFAFFATLFLCLKSDLFHKREKLQIQLDRSLQDNISILEENRKIIEKIKKINSDPQFIEHIAKEELGLIKPNEIIMVFSN